MIPPFILGMIPGFKSFFSLKNIAIIAVVISFGLGVWKIKSVFDENSDLHSTIAVQEQTIKNKDKDIINLNATVKNERDIQVEIKKRIALLEEQDRKRKKRVDDEKGKSSGFVSDTKAGADEVRKTNPDKLDEFYANKYNTILDCIQKTTERVDTSC